MVRSVAGSRRAFSSSKRMRMRSVATRADQVVKNALILRRHHVGGEAGLKFLAAALARNAVDIPARTRSSNSEAMMPLMPLRKTSGTEPQGRAITGERFRCCGPSELGQRFLQESEMYKVAPSNLPLQG
jgi:hypothetical protein